MPVYVAVVWLAILSLIAFRAWRHWPEGTSKRHFYGWLSATFLWLGFGIYSAFAMSPSGWVKTLMNALNTLILVMWVFFMVKSTAVLRKADEPTNAAEVCEVRKQMETTPKMGVLERVLVRVHLLYLENPPGDPIAALKVALFGGNLFVLGVAIYATAFVLAPDANVGGIAVIWIVAIAFLGFIDWIAVSVFKDYSGKG